MSKAVLLNCIHWLAALWNGKHVPKQPKHKTYYWWWASLLSKSIMTLRLIHKKRRNHQKPKGAIICFSSQPSRGSTNRHCTSCWDQTGSLLRGQGALWGPQSWEALPKRKEPGNHPTTILHVDFMSEQHPGLIYICIYHNNSYVCARKKTSKSKPKPSKRKRQMANGKCHVCRSWFIRN